MTYDARREAHHFSKVNRQLLPLLQEYYFANEALQHEGGAGRLRAANHAIQQFLGMRRSPTKEEFHG